MSGGIQVGADSIPSFFSTLAARHADLPAFTCLDYSLSYREIASLSDQVAAWLHYESALVPGDRVALQLPNLLQFPVLVLGILKAGMVLVNVNPRYTAAELQHQLCDSDARALFVFSDSLEVLARILPNTSLSHVVVTGLHDLQAVSGCGLQHAVPDDCGSLPGVCRSQRHWSLPEVLQRGTLQLQRCALPRLRQQPDDLALLQYTGGTTGVAKGAMLSHGNLLSNVAQLALHMAADMPTPGAVMVLPLPLYHIYAFTLGLLSSMAHGHHVLLIPDPRDMTAFMQALRPWRISGFFGISTLYRMLCQHAPFAELDFSSLRLCSAGGMALSPEVAQRWLALTGCALLEGYGLSECAPLVCGNTCLDRRPGSVARPVPGTELRLVDTQGREVRPGQVGEICVKGPQVMQGYWRAAAETAQVFDREGWLHTGDVGVLDGAGYLRIVDRIKDLIIISGFKVYPCEVEEHVCRHPQVSRACAVGVGDAYKMQIKLFVVSNSPALTAEELIHWCRQSLAPYKVPRHVEFRPHLPLSDVGKVLRKELRESSGKEDRFTA